MKNIIVTIDGPAGSGKGKIANYISKKWNLYHLDSGILYRRIADLLIKNKYDIKNFNDINEYLSRIKQISFKKHKSLRREEISKISSKIAIFPDVRKFVNKLQRNFVKQNINKHGFVIDGRDIGSVVFKNADLKLYIDVDVEIRAKRRYKQLIDIGEKSIYPQILKEIILRDKLDKNRKHSPLIKPKGAHVINNNYSLYYTYKQLNELINQI